MECLGNLQKIQIIIKESILVKDFKNLFRSSYEKKALELFEQDNNIISYEYENFAIPYNNGNRTTIPDFQVKLNDGREFIIEIKPSKLLTYWNNIEKIDAIKKYCIINNLEFKILTEKDLNKNILTWV